MDYINNFHKRTGIYIEGMATGKKLTINAVGIKRGKGIDEKCIKTAVKALNLIYLGYE